jgi:tetratricopeptide (TPR) repeat protein
VQAVKTISGARPAAFAIIVAAAAIVIYLPILSADFVYDDIAQITIDSYIHTPANFAEALSLSVMKKDVIDNNRPVMLLSLMFDSLLWGQNPFGYHLTNLLLHSLCSAMVFLLLYGILNRLFARDDKNIGALWAAFAGAMLFAIHPVGSEAVCVVTFREDLLAAFFILLCLIMAELFPTERKKTNILLSGLIVILIFTAVSAKENAVIAPLLLLVYWLFTRKAAQRKNWIKLIAAGFGAAAIFMFVRFTLVPNQSAIFFQKAPYLGGSFSKMLTIQPRIWAFQLLQLVRPDLLCADQTGYSIRFITLPAALIILALIITVAVLLGRKNIGFAVGIIFFCLAILPTSNLFPIYRPIADRYLYLPMVGICLALSALICRLKLPEKRWIKISGTIGIVIIYIFFGSFTIQRISVWNNNISLWQDTVRKNPFSFTGYNNLGFAYFDAGRFEESISALVRASELNPNEADVYAGLAISYEAMGLSDYAEEAFRKAVSLDKRYADYDSLVQTLFWTPRQAEKLRLIAERISQRR